MSGPRPTGFGAGWGFAVLAVVAGLLPGLGPSGPATAERTAPASHVHAHVHDVGAGYATSMTGGSGSHVSGPGPLLVREGSVTIAAVVQADAFRRSVPPDHRYHGLVNRSGGASGKSLFVTHVADSTIARALREMGADDAGGVPMAAWDLRWVPLIPQPATRLEGSRVRVTVRWDGAPRSYELAELLEDPGGRGFDIRFGGHEEHDDHWPSGCILCLFSCPGGVVSNGAYSIRDHQRGVTTFAPTDVLPPDGTPVAVTLTLVPD